MHKKAILTLLALGLGSVCLARTGSGDWPVGDQETIEKTLTLSGEPMRLIVDNVSGYVHLTGTSGSQVHVIAHKTIRAETRADLDQAKSEVKLDMTEQPGTVSIEYNAPWRCKDHCDGCCESHRRFYEVTYDIDVQAPRQARLVISTVNGGLRLEKIDGPFDVKGVNGAIHMSDVGGSGDAHTVNGAVDVAFSRNPSQPCSLKTVNGALDAYFQPGLSADLLFKTFNGEIYSDFDVTALPTPVAEAGRKDGMFVYRSRGPHAARAGRGGPQLSFDTLNGSIRLHEQQH